MNEEQLAEILAQQLDMLLAGQSLPLDLPSEVTELLPVAQQLSEAAPAPRPEFGPVLKESLLKTTGEGGLGTTTASTLGHPLTFIIAIGLLVTAGIALFIGIIWIGINRQVSLEPSAPSPSLPGPTVPALTTPKLSTAPAELTIQPPVNPTATIPPTAILDVLPPLTHTVEAEDTVAPPNLSPGPGDNNNQDDSNSHQSGGSDDHNRGHGNDDDHDDDDNPGKGN